MEQVLGVKQQQPAAAAAAGGANGKDTTRARLTFLDADSEEVRVGSIQLGEGGEFQSTPPPSPPPRSRYHLGSMSRNGPNV